MWQEGARTQLRQLSHVTTGKRRHHAQQDVRRIAGGRQLLDVQPHLIGHKQRRDLVVNHLEDERERTESTAVGGQEDVASTPLPA